jgi:hypothetical protein
MHWTVSSSPAFVVALQPEREDDTGVLLHTPLEPEAGLLAEVN